MRRVTWRIGGLLVGVAALGGVIWVGTVPATDSATTFPGALAAASAFTAIAIVVGVWPRSWFGRLLDVAPLRWVGDRSYGLYLWHWPLLVLLTSGPAGGGPEAGVPVWLGLLALALTLAAAELSYRLVETPVRRYGFRGAEPRLPSSRPRRQSPGDTTVKERSG